MISRNAIKYYLQNMCIWTIIIHVLIIFFSVRQVQCLLCSPCLAASPWGGQIEKGGRGFLSLLDQTVKE